MNIRFVSLSSAAVLLAATAAFGQSPFPSVSGQQQPSPFPSVSGQQQQQQQPQRQPSAFPSPSGQPAQQSTAPASSFPSVSGGGAAPAPMQSAAPPIAGMPGMPGGGGFGAPQQPQQPPCMDDFTKLRDETQRRGNAISAANKRKAAPAEACRLFNSFLEANQKMINFVVANQQSCGIPPNIPADMKKQYASVEQVRSRVCDAAANAQQQRPQGPSFSDVLGSAALPDANTTTRAGGSTFDTLSGNALSPR